MSRVIYVTMQHLVLISKVIKSALQEKKRPIFYALSKQSIVLSANPINIIKFYNKKPKEADSPKGISLFSYLYIEIILLHYSQAHSYD